VSEAIRRVGKRAIDQGCGRSLTVPAPPEGGGVAERRREASSLRALALCMGDARSSTEIAPNKRDEVDRRSNARVVLGLRSNGLSLAPRGFGGGR
jgi:hypothetical protein